MRTIIVDDEPWMLRHFEAECPLVPSIKLVGSFEYPLEALQFALDHRVNLAFVDVEMPEMDGITLAEKLREIQPDMAVVFVSAYDDALSRAKNTHPADFCLTKPYRAAELSVAVNRAWLLTGRLYRMVFARTFGAFELRLDGRPIEFQDGYMREVMALLVDRRGVAASFDEAARTLWPDMEESSRQLVFRRTLNRLLKLLDTVRLDGLVEISAQRAFIHTETLACDLFHFLDGNTAAIRAFSGEYMTGEPWAEGTKRMLHRQRTLFEVLDRACPMASMCACVQCLPDSEMSIVWVNEGFLALIDYTKAELEARFMTGLRALIAAEDAEGVAAKIGAQTDDDQARTLRFRLVTKRGALNWVSAVARPAFAQPDGRRMVECMLADISGTMDGSTEPSVSYEDPLTRLLTRDTARAQITCQLQTIRAGALIVLDIERFDRVNADYGRAFANTVLTDTAAILRRLLRSGDILSRLGGDELMVFLQNMSGASARAWLADASAALEKRLRTKTREGLTARFGGAAWKEGMRFDTLLTHALTALSAAQDAVDGIEWYADLKKGTDMPPAKAVTPIDTAGSSRYAGSAGTEHTKRADDELSVQIETMLGNVGRQLDVSRAYIIEATEDERFFVNTFEWRAEGISSEIDRLQAIPAEPLAFDLRELMDERGIVYCYDIRDLPTPLYQIVEPQGSKSMLWCALKREGRPYGIIGYDECRKRRYWSGKQIDTLIGLADTISRMLVRYRSIHGRKLSNLRIKSDGGDEHENNLRG